MTRRLEPAEHPDTTASIRSNARLRARNKYCVCMILEWDTLVECEPLSEDLSEAVLTDSQG